MSESCSAVTAAWLMQLALAANATGSWFKCNWHLRLMQPGVGLNATGTYNQCNWEFRNSQKMAAQRIASPEVGLFSV